LRTEKEAWPDLVPDARAPDDSKVIPSPELRGEKEAWPDFVPDARAPDDFKVIPSPELRGEKEAWPDLVPDARAPDDFKVIPSPELRGEKRPGLIWCLTLAFDPAFAELRVLGLADLNRPKLWIDRESVCRMVIPAMLSLGEPSSSTPYA
jgi:hypothetical protein